MSTETKSTRFEEWKVDCNECGRYYDSTCDGVRQGSARECRSYVATRGVSFASHIKDLEDKVQGLTIALCLVGAAVAVLAGVVIRLMMETGL